MRPSVLTLKHLSWMLFLCHDQMCTSMHLHHLVLSTDVGPGQRAQSRGNSCGASMAYPDMVSAGAADVGSATPNITLDDRNGSLGAPIRQEDSQHEGETETDGMSLIRRQHEIKGIPRHITRVLLQGWRTSKQKHHAVHLKRWDVFCRARKIVPYFPAIGILGRRFGILVNSDAFIIC